MRKLLILTALIPTLTHAQDRGRTWIDLDQYAPRNFEMEQGQRLGVIGVQPVLPVPQDRGPWGKGYSIVTSEREVADPIGAWSGGARTKRETVQRIVPNDALGQPMRGMEW